MFSFPYFNKYKDSKNRIPKKAKFYCSDFESTMTIVFRPKGIIVLVFRSGQVRLVN